MSASNGAKILNFSSRAFQECLSLSDTNGVAKKADFFGKVLQMTIAYLVCIDQILQRQSLQ